MEISVSLLSVLLPLFSFLYRPSSAAPFIASQRLPFLKKTPPSPPGAEAATRLEQKIRGYFSSLFPLPLLPSTLGLTRDYNLWNRLLLLICVFFAQDWQAIDLG